ncbi:MAG: DUF4271 domain-containing protein [Bacteroidota bacterium]
MDGKTIKMGIWMLAWLMSSQPLWAQSGQNPFELPGRQSAPAAVTPPPARTEGNPFEVASGRQRATISPLPTTDTPRAPIRSRRSVPPPTAAESSPIETAPPASAAPVTSANPFEVGTPASTARTPTESSGVAGANPFEVPQSKGQWSAKERAAPSPLLQPQAPKAKHNGNFLFWVSIGLLLLVTILITLYKPLVSQVYRSFLNDNILRLKQREQGSFMSFPLLALYLFYFLSGGFFLYLSLRVLGIPTDQHWRTLAWCTLGLAAIFTLKHSVLRIIAYVFPLEKELRQYSFTIAIFNIVLGITLLPVDLLMAYGPGDLPRYLFYFTSGSILLIYGFRIIRSLLIASRYISLHKFHFFMYLCTVEIAPTIVLVKFLLLLQAGAY